MAASMLLSAFTTTPIALIACRLLTGVGAGGMLPCISALASEFSNDRRREFAIGMLALGYAVGGVSGGLLASWLLSIFDWQLVFFAGAIFALVLFPLVLARLPESLDSLIARRGIAALDAINDQLRRFNVPPLAEVAPIAVQPAQSPWSNITRSSFLGFTATLAVVYLLHSITTYFYLGWIPQLTADRGFSPSSAARIAACASGGGIAGGLLLSVVAHRISAREITAGCLLGSTVSIAVFALAPPSMAALMATAALAGFFVFPGTGGILMVLARTYPTHLRATGTGIVLGIGRIGAAGGPVLAGYLLDAGLTAAATSITISLASMLAAVLLFVTARRRRAPTPLPGSAVAL